MVGKEGKGDPFDEALDPRAPDDPQEEEWQWEAEIMKQKIGKRKLPEREEGGASKKRWGGSFRKKG